MALTSLAYSQRFRIQPHSRCSQVFFIGAGITATIAASYIRHQRRCTSSACCLARSAVLNACRQRLVCPCASNSAQYTFRRRARSLYFT